MRSEKPTGDLASLHQLNVYRCLQYYSTNINHKAVLLFF